MFKRAYRDWKSLDNSNDPTAWELAKQEGYSPLGYAKLNAEIIIKLCLLIYIASKLGEWVKGGPLAWVVIIGFCWALWQLCKQFEGASPDKKRIEGPK